MPRRDGRARSGAGAWEFFINNQQFNHDKVNVFQLISINGQPYAAKSLQDTQAIPVGGEIVIRQRYVDYTGKFVYHGHILAHEDAGMMGIIEVNEPPRPGAPTITVAP